MNNALLQYLDPAEAPFDGRLALCISGGGDSVALLALLTAQGWTSDRLAIVHVDHSRRSESPQEANFVAAMADRVGVSFYYEKLTAEAAVSANMAELRRLRFDALWRLAAKAGCNALALAHTADDQREARVLALVRGSGLTGLAGMRPWKNRIWRPLLLATREQLRSYLQERQWPWLEDRSNVDLSSLRARIRHVVLPAVGRPLTQGEDLRVHLLQDEDDFIAQAAVLECDRLGRLMFDIGGYKLLPRALQRRVLINWLGDRAISAERIEALRLALNQDRPGRNRILELNDQNRVFIGANMAIRIPSTVSFTKGSRTHENWGDFGDIECHFSPECVQPVVIESASVLRQGVTNIDTIGNMLKKYRLPQTILHIWPIVLFPNLNPLPLPFPAAGNSALEIPKGPKVQWHVSSEFLARLQV